MLIKIIILILLLFLINTFNVENFNNQYSNNQYSNNQYYKSIEETQHKINPTYNLIQINNKKTPRQNNKGLVNVFWTGGYDSTFRICEVAIVLERPVQPIYMSYNIDSQSKNDKWVRNNRDHEYTAMKKIINEIHNKFPYTKDLIRDVIFVENEPQNIMFDQKLHQLNLWPGKRKIHQYNHLFKYAYVKNKPIDIGVLGIHRNTKFINYLHNNLIQKNDNWCFPKGHLLENIRFPIFKKTKTDLYNEAYENGFENILSFTFSCWFPKDGKNCGVCPMCVDRIIPSKLKL